MSPKHASHSLPHDPVMPAPRASAVALGKQVSPAARGEGARPAAAVAAPRDDPKVGQTRRIHWRPLAAMAMALPLLLSSLGSASVRAQDDGASPSPAPTVTPTPGPTPTPTPQPTPKPTPKPTPWPTPPGLKGLDVSHWNGAPDFADLREQDMRFVFSKATQGTAFVDDTFKRNTRAARDAGLLVGAYHFFDYRKGGTAQAKHYLDTLRTTTGLGSLLPLVVDVETLQSLGTPDKAKAKTRLHAMLDELYRQTGRYPMIYTSRYMWEKVVGAPTSFRQYPLWVACWKCETVHLPNGWSDWLFWQAGQFRFGGGVRLDGNVYTSNLNRLRLERQRLTRIDDGAEWAADRSVIADLRGYDGKDVRYAYGDEPFGPWLPFDDRFSLTLSETQGKQDVRLQLRSFRNVKSPVVSDSIGLDSVPPRVWGPRVSLRDGVRVQRSGTRVPTTVAMGASDATSGLDGSTLTAICGGRTRAADYSTAGQAGLTVQIDRSGCTLKGTADDVVGHRTSRALDPAVALFDVRHSSARVRLNGSWQTLKHKDSLAGTLARTSSKDATAKLAFEGAQFAVVARGGPSGGGLKVIVDGKRVDTIDLYAKRGDSRRIVYVGDVPRGSHEVKLRPTGSGSSRSSGSLVWLDAILVLDRRK